ncbi:MAG: AAA family ATPase [Bacteroidia bacterium]|nr:AAA family ATPase [Bacteroidia bacterium]MCX7652129.1 AAA family ATPase [Bacteroidia bacterium]MDW8416922.1 AAA family ATPase [Bacteroidia bacterium]
MWNVGSAFLSECIYRKTHTFIEAYRRAEHLGGCDSYPRHMAILTLEEILERLDRRELLLIAREGRQAGIIRPTYPLSHYDAPNLRRLLRRHTDRLSKLPSVQILLEKYARRTHREEAHTENIALPPISKLMQRLFPEVYGMDSEKEILIERVYLPLALPKQASYYGIKSAPTLLIEGPPGSGKSFIARRFAQASGFYYKVIHTPALASKWYGETEQRLRGIIHKASRHTPAILIFEELDALFPKRENNLEWLNGSINQFLLLVDELKSKGGVALIGITNRAHSIEEALLRSERFDLRLYISHPEYEERYLILTLMARDMPFAKNINWELWAERTAGFSRADLTALIRQAGYYAFLRHYREGEPQTITEEDLWRAFKSE